MGPLATLKFYEILLEETGAARETDHLRVVLDVNPHIPSRTRFHLYREASPVPGMVDSCLKLQSYPVDVIAVPCNSACAFLEDVRARVTVPILNIIEITARATVERLQAPARAAVLGGVVTRERRTYEAFLGAGGVELVGHSEAVQRESEAIIYSVKDRGPEAPLRAELERVITAVAREAGADAVILGCTEFSCLQPLSRGDLVVVDSTRALAQECVRICRRA